MTQKILIPFPNVGQFEKSMNKLIKLYKRIGENTITFKQVGEQSVEVSKDVFLRHVEYEFDGEVPKINGYTLVARMTHMGEYNNVDHLDKSVELPKNLQSRHGYCEHCNTDRYRKHLFLLQNEETEEIIQVGRTCVKDFTGTHNNPEDYANWYSVLHSIEELRTYTGQIPMEMRSFPLDEVLALSVYVIETNGYKRRQDADEDGGYTGKLMGIYLHNPHLRKFELTQEHYDKAQKAKEWALAIDTKDSPYGYFGDLQFFLKGNSVPSGKVALLASLYHVYLKRDKESSDGAPKSRHVYEVGDKLLLLVSVVNSYQFPSAYGDFYIYKFKDEKNNVFVWKTSKSIDLDENKVYNLAGTLKEHVTYKGEMQNVMTRCKLS